MYLSSLKVSNFRGIENLKIKFHKGINVIIGENASNKSAVLDILRIFSCLGKPEKEVWIHQDDFFIDPSRKISSNKITFVYEFSGLSTKQKGALYEYLVLGDKEENDRAVLTLEYFLQTDSKIRQNYFSGMDPEQKPSSESFLLFQHYYLDPLRDSERMLLSNKKNILGKLLNRSITRKDSKSQYENIIKTANDKLLEQPEIDLAKKGINSNIENIFGKTEFPNVGLRIDSSKVEYILSTIKPFLPHELDSLNSEGFQLWQNSMGYNNIIYFAVVLGDIREIEKDDKFSLVFLLIEEPEAHLHPQLQLCLYQFLRDNVNENTQLFITTHSPTLTSKVPLSELSLIRENFWNISECFDNRENEKINKNSKPLLNEDFKIERKKLERYLDVTKSQLFFSKAIILVEGISEEILIRQMCLSMGFTIEDYQLEVVNVRGTSFYPFLHLFNSSNNKRRLPQKVLVLSDDDRFPGSKDSKYSFDKLVSNNSLLVSLVDKLSTEDECTRVKNIKSVANGRDNIIISLAHQTFEFDLTLSNTKSQKELFYQTSLIKYIETNHADKFKEIKNFVDDLFSEKNELNSHERMQAASLAWKALGTKAEFAQNFSLFIERNAGMFIVPAYIEKGLKELIKSL